MKEFWDGLNNGYKDAIVFTAVACTILTAVTTMIVVLVITVSSYPT